jgi:ankyrin repeat protein
MVDRNGEPIEIPLTFSSTTAASAMGLEKCVGDLIEASAKNLSEKDESQCDPLTWAARNSHLGVLQYLLGKEADVESKSYGGLRPLHHACHVYNEEVITALLAKKADPNSKDEAGNTPFH